MLPAVFLDRDGTINKMVYHPDFGLVDSPLNPDEFELIPGAADSIAKINKLGLMTIIVSNQPGIAKGKFTLHLLQATTDKMMRLLSETGARIDKIYYCLHHPEGIVAEYRQNCECRKPRPGMLIQASVELGIDFGKSFMIGDGVNDIVAGHLAGTKTIFIGSRKGYLFEAFSKQDVVPDYIVNDLAEGVSLISDLVNE